MSDVVLHAIVLADGAHAHDKVAGLTLRERARRVACRAGAVRVLVIDTTTARAGIAAWWRDGIGGALLVIRAHDQMVHTPLVSGLAGATRAIAVTPDHAPAGAMSARGADADALADALTAGHDDLAIAASWLEAGARAVPHGEIARHPVTSRAERRAAERFLFRIIHKPQDNAITRYLFRPVSAFLTRVAVHTPITPNQVTYVTAILVALGVWLTIDGDRDRAVLGAVLILAGSYVDCVDGEVARLKLMSSKFGSWLDTIVDELSTVAQLAALGWHCHLWFDRAESSHFALFFDGWVIALGIGVVASLISIYCVYYNIIVLIGSSNSQDYVSRFDVVPGDRPLTVRLLPQNPFTLSEAATRPSRRAVQRRRLVLGWLATNLKHVVRRDFVCWVVVGLAALQLTHIAFGAITVGAVVAAAVLVSDHLRLRRQRREVARAGLLLVA